MRFLRSGSITALAVFVVLALAGQAIASTWNFSWAGWRGGDRDSRTWSASRSGNHQWVKRTCRADADLSGGVFDVEIRKVRSLRPDLSLGVKRYRCDDGDESKGFSSPGGGPRKFRFPFVSRGDVGISGSGHVSFP